MTIERNYPAADFICIAGGFAALIISSIARFYDFAFAEHLFPLTVILFTLAGASFTGNTVREVLHLTPETPTKPLYFSGYFILMFISMFAANFLTILICDFLHIELAPQQMVEEAKVCSWSEFFQTAATAIIFAPVAEELYFRGALFRRLKTVLPDFLSVGITAVIFAAAHGNMQVTASLLIMSVLLSREYSRTNSIRNCILLHACNNLIAVLQILYIRLSA